MLKLEKSSDFSSLAIRWREKDCFFEPRVLKALAIALLIHCGALIFFQVTPLTLFSTFTFSPIQVHSDDSIEITSILLATDREEDFLPPPVSLVPELDWISPFSELNSISSLPDYQAFQWMEEQLWPKWDTSLSLPLEEPSIQLSISGHLADYSLLASHPLLSQMQPFSPSLSPTYVSYQVQVDEKTGEIFWYEKKKSSENKQIDSLTEEILLQLRFATQGSLEFVQGNLDFVVLSFDQRSR